MMLLLKRVCALAAVAATLGATPALAYEAGDIILRTGRVTVDPQEDSGEIYQAKGAYAGSTLDLYGGLNSDSQLGLSFTYMLSANLGIEVLAATPFKHEISLESHVAGNILSKAAETKHLPPTISLQWYPMASSSEVQPYLGVGLNYTVFFEEDMSGAFDCATNALNAPGCADTNLELEDSLGLALQAGIDWQLTENIAFNAAVWWIDIDTEAKITSPGADTASSPVPFVWDTQTKFDVDIDPWVYMVGIAYKF